MKKVELLKDVLRVQSCSYAQWRMFAYIIRFVSKVSGVEYYVDNGNIYIVKGEALSYPCVVAHMDTVHDVEEDLVVLDFDGYLTGFNRYSMTQSGIGGDDKVGVFIALQALLDVDNIKIAFFRDEEVGCNGSYVADMEFFEDCRFVLQCDRKGNADFVTNAGGISLSSDLFQSDVKGVISRYGYEFANGMMTDVMALKETKLTVSCANISCGYYNPHMSNEYVVVVDVMACLSMVLDIIAELDGVYPHKHTGTKKYSYLGGYEKSLHYSHTAIEFCENCYCRTPAIELNGFGFCKTCEDSMDNAWECSCCGDRNDTVGYNYELRDYFCEYCAPIPTKRVK